MAPRSLLGPQPPAFLGTDDPWMRVPGHENAFKPKPKAKDTRNWQQKMRDALNEAGRYYLGPHGESAFGLLGTAAEFTDAADLRDAVEYGGKMGGAVQRGDWWGAAGAAPWMLAASGAAMLPGVSMGAVDEVVERGTKILDMLKSGKAKKVTDEMLDMGDPVLNARLNEFLFQNYDLPMDDASRMARAKDAGFAGPTYHATDETFVAVDPRRFDTGMSHGTGESAFWTTTQPKTADTYLPGAWVRAGNGGAPIGGGVERYYTEGGNVIPTMNRISNADEWDMGGGLYRTGDVSQAIKEARKDKSEAVVFKRIKDQGIMGLGSGSPDNISVAAIDPTSVRSRFARFDPRLRHLRNLNAGIAAALLGYGTVEGLMPTEDYP